MNPIKHVSIIMDGNGRWGLKHKGSRNSGHRAGINTVEEIIEETIKNKIKFLTLYTFSTENWKRPQKEVVFLFKLLENFLLKKINNLVKNKIKLKIIGNKKKLSIKLQKLLKDSEKRQNIRKKAYDYARFMTWSEVAKSHLKIIGECKEKKNTGISSKKRYILKDIV